MKTNHLFFQLCIIFAFQVQVNAQAYVPLAVDGAHWIITYDVMATPQPFDALWEYHANGDTIVEGQTYRKIYWRQLELNESFMPPFSPATAYELVGLLREDFQERKVYAVQLSAPSPSPFYGCPLGEESLLFDFSLSVGDTASFCTLSEPYFGDNVITNINAQFHWDWGLESRTFELDFWEQYYEGIGSGYGLFEKMFAPLKSQDYRYVVTTSLAYYCRETPCGYIVSTDELYEAVALTIFPNPANTWVSFDFRLAGADETAILEITDARGRLVHRKELSSRQGQYIWDTRHMSAGMYIYTLKTGRASKTGKLAIER
jgi:hypothetical protein